MCYDVWLLTHIALRNVIPGQIFYMELILFNNLVAVRTNDWKKSVFIGNLFLFLLNSLGQELLYFHRETNFRPQMEFAVFFVFELLLLGSKLLSLDSKGLTEITYLFNDMNIEN